MNTIRAFLSKYPFLKQFIKFCIVGGTAAIIHFSILYSFTEWLNIWYVISNAVGFLFAATFNFIINKLWTFRSQTKGRQIINQIVKFSIVLTAGLTINTLMIYSMTEFVGTDYRFSWVVATGIVTFWNFGFNRAWTFKKYQPQVELPKD